MRKFRMRRQDPLDLEAELRASRPEPRPDFVKELSAEIRETREPARRVRFLRLTPVMGGLTVLVLIGAGAFGGIAIATNGGGGENQSESVNNGNGYNENRGNGRNENQGNGHGNEGPADVQYVGDVTICHKPGTPAEQTLLVPQSALDGHIAHGDLEGPCG